MNLPAPHGNQGRHQVSSYKEKYERLSLLTKRPLGIKQIQ